MGYERVDQDYGIDSSKLLDTLPTKLEWGILHRYVK